MELPCKFCRLIARELPAYVVLEDELSFAFLDHRPLFPGHCLLLPKGHYPTLPELPVRLLKPLFAQAARLARAMEVGLKAEGSFVALNNVVSQAIPHLHIHVVPRRRRDGLRGFFWPRQRYRDEEHIREVQGLLTETLARLRTGYRA